jgi:hypothetical protein
MWEWLAVEIERLSVLDHAHLIGAYVVEAARSSDTGT